MFTRQLKCKLIIYHALARLSLGPDMQQTSAFIEDGVTEYSRDSSMPR